MRLQIECFDIDPTMDNVARCWNENSPKFPKVAQKVTIVVFIYKWLYHNSPKSKKIWASLAKDARVDATMSQYLNSPAEENT